MNATYITPINLKNAKVVRDWTTFYETHISQGMAPWDKDPANTMKAGDLLGFKLRDQVLFYRVIEDLGSTHRRASWENTSYNIPIGATGPQVNREREAVMIGHIEGYRPWSDIAQHYSANWGGPRGTQVLKNYNF